LREYASDTKRIAQASVKQTENSQLPFLAVFFQPNTAVDQEGWTVANQGSGPAINISWGTVQGGRLIYRIPSFAAGAKLNIHNNFAPLVGNQAGIEFKYESLSGLEYRTIITFGEGGVMHTQFVRPGV